MNTPAYVIPWHQLIVPNAAYIHAIFFTNEGVLQAPPLASQKKHCPNRVELKTSIDDHICNFLHKCVFVFVTSTEAETIFLCFKIKCIINDFWKMFLTEII